jgi:hypothetical protein
MQSFLKLGFQDFGESLNPEKTDARAFEEGSCLHPQELCTIAAAAVRSL